MFKEDSDVLIIQSIHKITEISELRDEQERIMTERKEVSIDKRI